MEGVKMKNLEIIQLFSGIENTYINEDLLQLFIDSKYYSEVLELKQIKGSFPIAYLGDWGRLTIDFRYKCFRNISKAIKKTAKQNNIAVMEIK